MTTEWQRQERRLREALAKEDFERARSLFEEIRGYVADHQDLMSFPPLIHSGASLSHMEKSLLGHLIMLVQPHLILELGVHQGVTAQFMCDFLAKNDIDATVVGFDLPKPIENLRQSSQAIRDLEASSSLELVPGSLPQSLSTWLGTSDEPIDLALVDDGHDYDDVMEQLKLLWPRLASDGYIVFDDYLMGGVRVAIERFAARHDAMVVPFLSPHKSSLSLMNLAIMRRRPYRLSIRNKVPLLWATAVNGGFDLSTALAMKLWRGLVRASLRRESRR